MKKFLLAAFMALGIGAQAQLNFTGDFEEIGPMYGQFGGGTSSSAAACSGDLGGAIAISNTVTQSGWMIDTSQIPQISNGQRVNLSAKYKKPAGFVGNISLAYFIKDPVSNLWTVTPIGTTQALTAAAITTCNTLTASIAPGVLQPNAIIGLGVWITKGTANGSVYVDDISFDQDTSVTTVPECTTLTAPADGSTVSGGSIPFSWTAADGAINYKLQVGTTPGGTDVFNGTVTGTTVNISVPTSATLYAKITPSNTVGDAVGCTEISFMTNSQVTYCGPIISTSPNATYPISQVTFAGKGPNTSSAAVGSPAYEDFTSYKFDVNVGGTYPLTVVGTGLGANRFGMTVFIDWNNNGSFDDPGEQYFTTPANFKGGTGATITLTGDIAVPGNVTVGDKRMRIKYNFSSSTTSLHEALQTGCTNMINGQTEDYTITVAPMLAVAGATKNAVAVYPNPFQDILKISDVKGVSAVSISDATGRQVKSLKAAAELQLGDLQPGLYIVTLHMEDGTVKSLKAIKK